MSMDVWLRRTCIISMNSGVRPAMIPTRWVGGMLWSKICGQNARTVCAPKRTWFNMLPVFLHLFGDSHYFLILINLFLLLIGIHAIFHL